MALLILHLVWFTPLFSHFVGFVSLSEFFLLRICIWDFKISFIFVNFVLEYWKVSWQFLKTFFWAFYTDYYRVVFWPLILSVRWDHAFPKALGVCLYTLLPSQWRNTNWSRSFFFLFLQTFTQTSRFLRNEMIFAILPTLILGVTQVQTRCHVVMSFDGSETVI